MAPQSKPPLILIAEFVNLERLEDVAVLTAEDGFDAETMRVLAAWEKTEQRWSKPRGEMPTRPTAAAWRWLVSGWELDIPAIADAAAVTYGTARDRMAVLTGNRLVYPDGTMSKFARNALRAHMGMRLNAGKGPRQAAPAPRSGDRDGGTN